MKNILFFLLLIASASCGQANQEKTSTRAFPKPDILNSKYVALRPDTNKMMLIENVVIKFGDLSAEADSVLWDKSNQSIIVFGARKTSFKEKDISFKDNNQTIRYKKGETRFHTD